MAGKWHQVDEPGCGVEKKAQEPRQQKLVTGIDDLQEGSGKSGRTVEYRISYVRPVEPASGFRWNKPYDIEGRIEPLVEKITKPRIVLHPIGTYKGTEDDFFPNGIEVFPDSDGRFRCTCDTLYNAMEYDDDEQKGEDATWDLTIRATGTSAEADVESDPLSMPRSEQPFVQLRKGHYDDNGASRYDKPREGDDYVSGDAVKHLQQDLISRRFLPEGEDDGFFGSKTDDALRLFQEYAIDTYRMPRKHGKLVEVDTVLQQSQPDGLVGPKTRDELDRWKKEDWVKPAVVLRHGDYDDEGVNNRLGKRGGDDHHIKDPVREPQRVLKGRGYEEVGAEDGWFGDKTKNALINIQTHAADHAREVNGEVVEAEVTFFGKAKGVYDEPTRNEVETWVKNDYKRPPIYDGPILIYLPEDQCYVAIDDDLKDRFEQSCKKCNDLAQEIQDHLKKCEAAETEADREEAAKRGEELKEKVKQFTGPSKNPTDIVKEVVALNPMNSGGKKVVGNMNYLEDDFLKEVEARKIRGDDPELKKRIKNLVKGAEPGVAAKASVWKSEQIEKDWPDIWKYKGKHEATSKGMSTHFGYTAEAQWMRLVAGASLDAEFNLTEREVKFGGQGSVEYILGKGEVEGLLYLPDNNGINVFSFFAVSERAREIIDAENVILRFRMDFGVKGCAYAGAAASALVALPSIELTEETQEANVQVDGSLEATASAGVELSHLMKWSDTDSPEDFKDLTKLFAMGEGSAGVAAAGTITCGYVVDKESGKGVFRFSIGAKVVVGLGAKLATGFDLGLEAGAELVAHMLYLIKSHRLEGLLKETFRAACLFIFSKAVAIGRGVESAAEGIFERFTDAAGAIRDLNEYIFDELQEFKGDFFDGVQRLQKDLQNPYTLAVGLQVAMRTFEPQDFDRILGLLRQTRTDDDNHELKWVLRYISGTTDKEKGINEGVRKLRAFGSTATEHATYAEELRALLGSRGITW